MCVCVHVRSVGVSVWGGDVQVNALPTVTCILCQQLHVYVRLAITSVWKIRFQQCYHFSVAINELFQMVCATKKIFSTLTLTLTQKT